MKATLFHNPRIKPERHPTEQPLQLPEVVRFNHLDAPGWQTARIELPQSWDDFGWSREIDGPVWCRCELPLCHGHRRTLRCRAISYFCHIWLNHIYVGAHRGMWDSFEFDIEHLLNDDGTSPVFIAEIYKPSPRWFPIEESLAGFIPYVNGCFGGIWQPLQLIEQSGMRIEAPQINPVDDHLFLSFYLHSLSTPLDTIWRIILDGNETVERRALTGDETELTFKLPRHDLLCWSCETPHLYPLTIEARASSGEALGRYDGRAGIRQLRLDGERILINEKRSLLRGVLHWMSDRDHIAPVYDVERFGEEMDFYAERGFNLIKLCLAVPPQEYFQMADERGIYLWLELPLWLPRMTPELQRELRHVYRQLARMSRVHPSVIICTLGCELNENVSEPFLRELFGIVRQENGIILLRDNSGSAEAYGGVELEQSDFDDYHFYSESPCFGSLPDTFTPPWRRQKPLLFGEFCDSDTLRSPEYLRQKLNQQIGKMRYDENELCAISHRRSEHYRADIIEQARRLPQLGGYVITSWRDTPLVTSGLRDEDGNDKFSPSFYQNCNSRMMIHYLRESRRHWLRGGDRPHHLDDYNLHSGEQVKLYPLISGDEILNETGSLLVEILFNGEIIDIQTPGLAQQGYPCRFEPLCFTAPSCDKVMPLSIRSQLRYGDDAIPLGEREYWLFPIDETPLTIVPIEPLDRDLISIDLMEQNSKIIFKESGDGLRLSAFLGEDTLQQLRHGKDIVIVASVLDNRYLESLPFWREAVVLPDLYRADGSYFQLPQNDFCTINWKAVSTDLAIDSARLDLLLRKQGLRVTAHDRITRIDARNDALHSYWRYYQFDSGANLTVTTLRPWGGLGKQPLGLTDNILGDYLIRLITKESGKEDFH